MEEQSTAAQKSVHFSANEEFVRRFKLASLITAAILLCLNLITLAGWGLDISWIKRPFPGLPLMQSAAALTLLVAMTSLIFSTVSEKLINKVAATVLGLLVMLVGAIDFADFASGSDLHVVNTLWAAVDGSMGITFPGPVAPDVAINFIVLGLALALLACFKNRWYLYQPLALLIALPNILVVCSFAAGVQGVCAFFNCVKFSPVTSTVLTTAALCLLFASVDKGVMRIFVSTKSGGVVTRRISIAILVSSPIALALVPLILAGGAGENPIYDKTIANALLLGLTVTLIVGCVAWVTKKMDVIETKKLEAEEMIEQMSDSLASMGSPALKRVCLQCAREFEDTDVDRCPDDGSPIELVAEGIRPGSKFAQKYEVVRCLGSGGISTVYLVRHTLMDKRYALKLLRSQFASDAKYLQRFRQEAKAMSKLSHPNIAAVQDFGISPDGQAYLVMEYLEGESLDDLGKRGPVPWRQAVPIFLDICEGLFHAHSNGILHRDLKPANVMLITHKVKGRLAKIVDFGLARTVDAAVRLTQTGDLLGSPAYMSPEQCRAEKSDERTDIYSLGALMYDVLVGSPPILGMSVFETILLQTKQAPKPFPTDSDVPDWLQQSIFKMLEKQPSKRQQSAEEVLFELQAGVNKALLSS